MAHERSNTTNSSTHGNSDSYQSGRSFRRTDFRFVRRMALLANGSRPSSAQASRKRWEKARPREHDSVVYQRPNTRILWMCYFDQSGKRIRGSTFTEDWQEANEKLRERLGALEVLGNLRPELIRRALLFRRPCCMCASTGKKRPCTNRANMSGIQTIWVNFERKADSPNCWKQ